MASRVALGGSLRGTCAELHGFMVASDESLGSQVMSAPPSLPCVESDALPAHPASCLEKKLRHTVAGPACEDTGDAISLAPVLHPIKAIKGLDLPESEGRGPTDSALTLQCSAEISATL